MKTRGGQWTMLLQWSPEEVVLHTGQLCGWMLTHLMFRWLVTKCLTCCLNADMFPCPATSLISLQDCLPAG